MRVSTVPPSPKATVGRLHLPEIHNKIRALADGSSMLGVMALENGLIDRIGGMYEVEQYLSELIGEDVEVCW